MYVSCLSVISVYSNSVYTSVCFPPLISICRNMHEKWYTVVEPVRDSFKFHYTTHKLSSFKLICSSVGCL